MTDLPALLADPELSRLADAATPLADWPGYSIDDQGRVFSSTGWRGHSVRQLVPTPNDDGYPKVRLVDVNGRRRNMAVHRLVAQTFLPPRPSSDHEIRHLNGDRADSRAVNLRWGTRVENAADRDAHGHSAKGETHGSAKLTAGQVVEIRRCYALGGFSQMSLARAYGVSERAIGMIVRGETWT